MGLRPLAGARVVAYLTQASLCFSPLVRWATTRAAATRLPSQSWLGGTLFPGTHWPHTVRRNSVRRPSGHEFSSQLCSGMQLS
eukprot:1397275-Pyramimonas_sp.AAC.1